jgi:hypothetical protein
MEERGIDQIEQDNPGFFLRVRYGREGPDYTLLWRDETGTLRHVHCRDKHQLQPLIDRIRARRDAQAPHRVEGAGELDG